MKEGKQCWQLIWAGVRLIVLGALLYLLTRLPEIIAMQGVLKYLYYVAVVSGCVICLTSIYSVARNFFGKKNNSVD